MSGSGGMDDLVSDVTKIIKLAYSRGFMAGGTAMRASILRAATDLDIPTHDKIAASIGGRGKGPRSRYGSVEEAVVAILTQEPNLTSIEVEERGLALNNGIAVRSFSNQLRRYEGTKYKRDEATDRWSLIEGVTAGP